MPIEREEKRLGALQLAGHLARILGFLRGRRRALVGLMLLSTLVAVLELCLPLIVRQAIDAHIQPPWIRIDLEAAGPDLQPEPGQGIQPAGDRYLFMARTELSEARIRALRARAALDAQGWFRVPDGRFFGEDRVAALAPVERQELRREDSRGVVWLAGVYLGLLVLIFGLSYWVTYGLNTLGQLAVLRVREALWQRLLRLPIKTFDQNPVGRLVTRVTNDPANVSELFTSVLATALADLVMFTGVLAAFFWMDPTTALGLLAMAPAIFGLAWWFKRTSAKIYRRLRVELATLNTNIQESVSGLAVIRSFVHEDRARGRFEQHNQANFLTQVRLVHAFAVFRPVIDACSTLAVALVVWTAGGQVIAQQLSLGTLVAFLLYLKMLFRPLQSLAESFNTLQSAVVSSERLLLLLDQPEEPSGDRRAPADQPADIVFDQVHFGYEPDRSVLRGVSFEVRPKEKVALVGPTGSGKSTIISLLLGFYPLAESGGQIRVAGIPVAEWDRAALRGRFALVQQDLYLFSGTLRDNVGLFEQPEPDRLAAALRVSRVDQLVGRLPAGLEHALNERGLVLSQGERQLVSFARALAHGGPVLVLDEATSSVDSATEALIQEALENLLRDRTALVVAHRLSTVQSADRILVLSAGRIVEQGSHAELLAKDGLYARLYHTQLAAEQGAPRPD